MTPRTIRFEQSFEKWTAAKGMTWREETIPDPADPAGGMRSIRITPAGDVARVLFALHGAGNDALFGWVGLFKDLLLSKTSIFTFDLPGHGRGGRTVFGAERARMGVVRAFEMCLAGSVASPVHALGVSLGGSLLLAALPVLDDRVASAALVVAPLKIELSGRSFLGELRPHNLHVAWREREHYGLTGLIPSFGPFKRDLYPLRLEEAPPPGAFGYIESLNRALDSLELLKRARSIRVPVLLAYGEEDQVVPIEQGERLATALRHSELLRVRKGTHLSTPLEPLVRNRVARWLREWE